MGPSGSAPQPVAAASALAILNAALGIASLLVTVATVPGSTSAGLVGLVIAAALVALTVLVAVQVRRGRRWARTALVVLAVLDVLGALVLLLPHVASAGDPLALAQAATSTAATVLLFLPASDAWFTSLQPDAPGR